MAYFRNNDPENNRNMPYADNEAGGPPAGMPWMGYQSGNAASGYHDAYDDGYQDACNNGYDDGYDDGYEDSYDDGFDQLTDDETEDEYAEEEEKEIRKIRLQTIFDVSNLTATIIGAVLVLLLLQLLFSIIDYVRTDFELNFSLLMSRI